MTEPGKYFADAGSVVLTLGTVVGYLPSVAAMVSILWMAIRIYETCTVQRWLYKATCNLGEKSDD